jgi:hypothetical protein
VHVVAHLATGPPARTTAALARLPLEHAPRAPAATDAAVLPTTAPAVTQSPGRNAGASPFSSPPHARSRERRVREIAHRPLRKSVVSTRSSYATNNRLPASVWSSSLGWIV